MDRGLPVFFACVCLPLVVRLHVYSEDMGGYTWFGFDDRNLTDFFNHGKAMLLYVIAAWMIAKLLWECIQGRRVFYQKRNLIWFGIVGVFYLLSAIFARNTSLALKGGYQSFQGFFALAGYMVLCVYMHERMRSDEGLQFFYWCNMCVAVLSCIIGILQIVGYDPFLQNWMQRLITPSIYGEIVIDREISSNTVYLTLGNPNYASIFLAAQIIMVSIFWIVQKKRLQKILLSMLDVCLLICLWFTYSRVGLWMLFVAGMAAGLLCHKQWKMYRKKIVLIVIGISGVLLTLDGLTGFRFVERLERTLQSFFVERRNCNIDGLHTESDGIYFSQNGKNIRIYVKDSFGDADDIQFETCEGIDITQYYESKTGVLHYDGLEEVSVLVDTIDSEKMIVLQIGETRFRFALDDAKGYMLYIGNGHYDAVQPVEKIGFEGIEHIASGRLYIWSRTLPLLKNYWLLGCGADNFFLIYPQNDYLGKAQYCNDPLTIVEKPHNAYLRFAVEQGVIALIVLLVVYGLLARKMWLALREHDSFTCRQWLIFGCFLVSLAFMAAFFFDDWDINIMPLFWMSVGIVGKD